MQVRQWELDGSVLREINQFSVPGRLLRDLAYRADGKVLACATSDAVLLYDLEESEQEEPMLRVPCPAYQVALTADGRGLVCNAGDQGVRLFSLDRPQPRQLGILPAGTLFGLTQMALSPDAQWLATADSFYRIRLWNCHNPARPQERDPLTGAFGSVSGLAFSPRESLLACATQDGHVRLWQWNGNSWSAPTPLPAGGGTLHQLAFSADGQWLALGADGEMLRRWNLRGPAPLLQEWEVPGLKRTNGIGFTPDNVLVTAGGGKHLRFYDPVQPREIAAVDSREPLQGLAVAQDGRRLASSGQPGNIARVWERDRGQVKLLSTLALPAPCWSQVFSPEGDWLACACAGADPRILLWHLQAAEADKPQELRRHAGKILHLGWSPDGRWLASAGDDARVVVWKMPEGQPVHDYPLPGIPVQLAFAPDSRHLAVGNSNGVAYVFRLPRR
jgi:WD40 repeat protein